MWKVPRLSPGQLKDVRPEDQLHGGWFRKCDTYRGGGGYDKFPVISAKHFGKAHNLQFIVQLYGCHLDCPYCYVTRQGVWGEWRPFSTQELVDHFRAAYRAHGTTVFHLMGGSPALQMKQWPELLQALDKRCDFDWVFHSDLLLTEFPYRREAVDAIWHKRALYAVDVKGLNQEEHLANTRKSFDEVLFYSNLDKVERACLPYYLTFTNVEDRSHLWDYLWRNWPGSWAKRRGESFNIDLIDYDALPHVDEVPWGAQHT